MYVLLIGATWSLLATVTTFPAQMGTAFFFTYYRANVFAFPGIFNFFIFGPENCGFINGCMYALAAPFNYAITPALHYATVTCNGNYRSLWLILTVVLVLPLIMAILLKARSRDVLVQPDWAQEKEEEKSMGANELSQRLMAGDGLEATAGSVKQDTAGS